MVTAQQLQDKIKEKIGGEVVEVTCSEGGCSDKFEV